MLIPKDHQALLPGSNALSYWGLPSNSCSSYQTQLSAPTQLRAPSSQTSLPLVPQLAPLPWLLLHSPGQEVPGLLFTILGV